MTTDRPDDGLIVVAVDEPDGVKAFGRGREKLVRAVELDGLRLREGIERLRTQVADLFSTSDSSSSPLKLDFVQVQIEITTKGEVRLIGAVSAEVKGGIILQFSRRAEA